MSTSAYNVIWADDECFTLKKDETLRKYFDKENIEVLRYVQTSEELRDALECFMDKIDAVIVDGNFPRTNVMYVENDDISGLVHTVSFIEAFNIKRDIPFFLYTAKKDEIQNWCKNGEIDYFTQNERIIQKGDIVGLSDCIKKAVDHINSTEFLVRKHYQKFLDMAEQVNETCSNELYNFLIEEARDTKFQSGIQLFNNLRKMLEQVNICCHNNGITPVNYEFTLNEFKNYFKCYLSKPEKIIRFSGYTHEDAVYKPINGLMPLPIAKTIDSLIDIVQDGSHQTNKLAYSVSEYVSESSTPFVFRSCLYQVIDIIRWYNETIEKIESGKLSGLLYTVEQKG